MQISKPQSPEKELHCPFGNISVISSVCHAASSDPLDMLEETLDELRSQVGLIVPESEEPTAFVTYGTIGTQVKLTRLLMEVVQTKNAEAAKESAKAAAMNRTEAVEPDPYIPLVLLAGVTRGD